MSKQEQRDRARASRLEAVRKEQRRRARRRTALIVAASVAAVAVVAGVLWAVIVRTGSGSSANNPGKVALTGLKTYPGLARDHVSHPVVYPQTPPVGGVHSAQWLNCGVYTAPVPNENAVHSLEHGAVWITYRPGLSSSQVATIVDDVKGKPYGLVSPYPGLPSPVVASAWGVQLKLGSADDPRLKAFITTYESGSHAPEPGGQCTGGLGTPQP